MENNCNNLTFFDLIKKLIVCKWRIVAITFTITLIGTIYVISLPREYTAKIEIVVEHKNNHGFSALGALGGMNLSNNVADGLTIELAPSILRSCNFLLEFYNAEIKIMDNERKNKIILSDYLEKYQKKPWWKWRGHDRGEKERDSIRTKYELNPKQDKFIRSALNIFSVTTEKKTNVMALFATTQDPLVSVVLVDSLAKKLESYLTSYQTGKVQQELEQWINITEVMQERYYKYQERYAKLTDQNQNLTTTMAKANVDRLYNDMNIALQAYTNAASRVEIARTKLFENTPVYTALDRPILDKTASYPKRKLVVCISFILGLFLGIGSVIIGDILKMIISQSGQDDTASH